VPPQAFALAIMQNAYEATDFGHKKDDATPCAPSGVRAGDLWNRPRLYDTGTPSRAMHLRVIGNEATGIYSKSNRPKAAAEVIKDKLGCWNNATSHCAVGSTLKEWITYIQFLSFAVDMRECGDPIIDTMISGRFPPGHCAVVFDPLSLLVEKQGDGHVLKERTREIEDTRRHLFQLLSKFVNALYVCTTYGRRWEVDGNWDEHSTFFRCMAADHGVSSWDGNHFWEKIFPWCTREGKTQYLNLWHHGEIDGHLNLVHEWETVLFSHCRILQLHYPVT